MTALLAPASSVLSIQLDVAMHADELITALMELTADTSVSYHVDALEGPGGGWPAVTFVGTLTELTTVYGRYDRSDGVDPEFEVRESAELVRA